MLDYIFTELKIIYYNHTVLSINSFIPNFYDAWKVLTLFLIPIGGGIPAGVLVGKNLGISWFPIMVLYLISDVILAVTFEPIFHMLRRFGKKFQFFAKLNLVFKTVVHKSMAHYGTKAGPMALILISFGSDPMTGRAATHVAGHRFISGWILSIAGDMIYFSILMISTLWLNNIIGDGTVTVMIILALMIILPYVIRRFKHSE